MLGKEDNVDANEGQPEVQLADRLRIHVAGHFREPIIPPGKDSEDRAQREHVMEMRNHVISILQRSVDAGIGEYHAGHAADSEEKNEAGRPQHRCLEFERAAPHGGDPREDLHAGRHGDHHRSDHEISLGSSRHADGVHVVRPHHKADAADRHHRIGHAEVAENRFLREGRHDLTDHSKTRHDQDVDLRMSEEPEQVLEQNRVATAGRSEKSSSEIAVGQQHRDSTGEHRHRQQNEEHRDQLRPDEQRHLVHRHSGSAHVENGRNEVDRPENRRRAGKME